MSALNSYSLAKDDYGYLTEMISTESSERVLEGKGLFIIPYDTTKLVAFVRCEIDVVNTVNESRTLWSNPELSFYGYCHIRRFKQSVGNPVQINQRNQILYQWFPQENIDIINTVSQTVLLLSLLTLVTSEPLKLWLVSPLITDLSFGFQRAGKFKVKVTIGYFNRSIFPPNATVDILQDVPSPSDTLNTDPSSYKDLGDPNTPVSAPYIPGNNDFGESTPGQPEPEEPIPTGAFYVIFQADVTGFTPGNVLSNLYSGAPLTSLSRTPTIVGNNFVLQGQTAQGSVNIGLTNLFVTPEQNDQFLSTFRFIGYQPFQ